MERMALFAGLAMAWKRRTGHAGGGRGAASGVLSRIEAMLHVIAARFAEPLTLRELAAGTGWHPHYAAGQFKRWIGVPPGEFLLRQRVAHARHLLLTGEAKVIEVGEACGFASQSSFYTAFRRLVGQTPASYRREGGRGEEREK